MEAVKRAIPMRDGVKLYTEVMEHGAKYWVIAVHGIGEHLGRHNYLKEVFGFDVNVFQFDLRGHGRSGGEKAYIDPFDQYMQDLDDCVSYLRERYKMENYIIYGHSMGALISCGYTQSYIQEDCPPRALVVNAPPIGVGGPLGKFVKKISSGVFSKISSFKPSIPLGGLVDVNTISHSKQAIKDYQNDPLVHLKLHTKLLLEMISTSRRVFSKPINDKVEKYLSYGSEDELVSIAELERYTSEVDQSFKIHISEGARHEQYSEIEKYREPYMAYLRETVKNLIF